MRRRIMLSMKCYLSCTKCLCNCKLLHETCCIRSLNLQAAVSGYYVYLMLAEEKDGRVTVFTTSPLPLKGLPGALDHPSVCPQSHPTYT